jgi:hypothetical protein
MHDDRRTGMGTTNLLPASPLERMKLALGGSP